MKKQIISLVLFSLLVFGCNKAGKGGCNSEHEGYSIRNLFRHNHAHEHEGKELEPSSCSSESEKLDVDEIIFTHAQAELVGLETTTVLPGVFREVIKTSGQIQAAQGDEMIVIATCNGTVSFFNSSFVVGSAVKKGETLITISTKDIHEGDPGEKAKIAYETALREYERAETLIKDQIISAKAFEQIYLNYKTAKTVYEAHAGNLTESGVKVTSPINGYVKSRIVEQGEYVVVGQPIATISKNKSLQLRAEVSQRHFKDLKNISDANFKMAYDDRLYRLDELNGRLLSFAKASDASSFYVPIIFEFDNVEGVMLGAFAEVYLLASPTENVISIPLSALTEEQGIYFVYLALGDERYKKQEVSIGPNDGENVRVSSGLKSGDKVVSRAVYQVKLAANTSAIPHTHTH